MKNVQCQAWVTGCQMLFAAGLRLELLIPRGALEAGHAYPSAYS